MPKDLRTAPTKDLRTAPTLLLVVVALSFSCFGCGSNLNAAFVQDSSAETTDAIQIEEASDKPEPAGSIQTPVPSEETVDESLAVTNAPVKANGAIQILTKESFTRWINPLIFLFLVVSFLCWLLALISPKPTGKKNVKTKENEATSNSGKFGHLILAKPDSVDDLTKIGGIDSDGAKRLNEAGIWHFKQLHGMTAQQRANLQRELNMPHIRWYSLAGLVDDSQSNEVEVEVTTKLENGSTSIEEAAAIRVDHAAKNESVRSPKYRSETEAKTSAYSFSSRGTDNAIESNPASDSVSPTPTAEPDSDSLGESHSNVFVAESTESVVAEPSPVGCDDLTRLAGVDADGAARLKAAGFDSFDQLKELDDKQASLLAKKCDLPNADISDWRRCIYAWGRGIETTSETEESFAPGSIHGIQLPEITKGVFDGEKLVAYSEQVIFRGSNPECWGRGVGDASEGAGTSLSCDSIRSDINYLRIRRVDTRESVVVPITKGQLFANGDQNESGWNGSSEVFFGGRHIGIFAQDLPQEVETKFSQGGWGFGHRYDHNDRQEWGWAGRVIEPTAFEISVGCIGNMPGTVVFRGSDPSTWNTKSRDGKLQFSDPVESVKHPVNFVRIMREATGEAVIVRVDGNHVLDEGFDPRCGWNGSCSEFSGGRHLGVYHCDLAQDFETRFEFGGWGFGHPYNDNDRQAWGWAGRQLPETVFEISLLDYVPDFMVHEIVE